MKVVKLREVWWLWLGEASAVSVASEEIAIERLLSEGKEYVVVNSFGRSDMACAEIEITWDKPLPEGESYHKTVSSPVFVVKHNGIARKCMQRLTPSKLASVSRGWNDLIKSNLPAWWPDQYRMGITSPEVLILKGKKPLELQLEQTTQIEDSPVNESLENGKGETDFIDRSLVAKWLVSGIVNSEKLIDRNSK